MLNPSQIEKSGAPRVKPNWRYEALYNPASVKLQGYTSIPASNSGCLKRFLKVGRLSYELNYKVPTEIKRYISTLSERRAKKLTCLWNQAFKRSKQKKISIDTDPALFEKHKVWNAFKVNQIQDKFLVRAIKHISQVEYDRAIAFALDLHSSQDHNEIFKFIGYCIYAKVSDQDIAKRWNIPVVNIAAIRQLFFDFSGFPKDRVANFTFLRQLANNGVIDDMDFAYYKRIFELGELGLKAQTDFFNLTPEEKKQVEEYIGKSVTSNVLNLNFCIRTQKDANNYGSVVTNLAGYHIKEAERTYFAAKTKNLESQTRRLEASMLGAVEDLTDIDRKFLDLLRQNSLVDSPPEYKTLAMLN